MEHTTALVSGGKDSIYAAYLAESQGWPVHELLTLEPDDPDSWMFHTPNLDLVRLQAQAWGKAHRAVRVPPGDSEAETSMLERALDSGERGPIAVGAIASSFQWSRVIRAASRVGRRVYAPLWRVDARRVVAEEIAVGLDIRIAQVAAEPLPEAWLGRRLDLAWLEDIERRAREVRSVNVAGEGGEYETVVLDAPFFRQRIVVDRVDIVPRGGASRWAIRAAHLESKPAG
ncbi:MAG: diphthine--ammonia ligase [Thermoplasmata archaeon]